MKPKSVHHSYTFFGLEVVYKNPIVSNNLPGPESVFFLNSLSGEIHPTNAISRSLNICDL